ncbi:MAG TPA: mechanosensitive ion channel domain-containing protein [Gammaproteobacteria bacterium]
MIDRPFPRLAAAALLLIGASAAGPASLAQDVPPPTTAPARAAPLDERLDAIAAEIEAARERLAPLAAAVDVSEAEAWIAASPHDRLAERAAAEGLSEAERQLWQQALEHEEAGAERIRGALSRAALATAAGDRLAEALQRVDELRNTEPAAPADQDVERPLSVIDQDIATLDARRTQIGLGLDQRRETLGRLEEQLRGQADAIETLRRERDAAADRPASDDAADDPALAEAREAEKAAFERRRDAPLIQAQLDARSLPVRIDVLKLEIAVDELELAWIGQRLAALRVEFDRRSTAALSQLTRDLQRLVEREPDAEQRFAAQLARLRALIDQAAETQSRIRGLQAERQRYAALGEDLSTRLENVRLRLEHSGLTDAVGTLFLEERRRLNNLADLDVAARQIGRELDQSRLRIIGYRELAPTGSAAGAALAEDEALASLRELERRVADALLQGEAKLIEELEETDRLLREVGGTVDELERILSEALLWWPSHVPVSVEWAARAPNALFALLDPAAWRTTGAALRQVTLDRPVASLLTLLVAGLLYRAGRGTGRHLRELAEKTQHRFTDSMTHTWKAMGWSLLRVLPAPVLLGATGFRLERLPDTDPGVDIIAAVLWTSAIWWLAGHLLAIFISRNGVATVHFNFNPTLVARLRRHVKWYLPAQFVLIMALALGFAHPDDIVLDVFGRIALVASGVLGGFLGWRLLAPSSELGSTFKERRRRFFRGVTVLYALALVVLSLAGYLLTVSELFARTIDTVVVVCVVALGYQLAARGLILSEMRLRLRRLREQREKAAAVESNSLTADGGPDLPDPHLSIEDVNHQTRTLLRVAAGASLVLALFWVWSEVLPALTWLDNYALWTRTVEGSDQPSVISLQDAVLAIGLGWVFVLAARNLPGLVEILLARSTDMDAAGRYTAAMLLRYTITVVAVVTVFSRLGFRWAELQWMVAALTLGLGFGLQEVVANFVSGLIILFERPVRVGDTITIGEYSGTVARIRTRATTIIDWDNREIVVPNKNFITERLINWTLSDTVTRIVMPIAVRYDTDPDLVIETLLRIAKAHPAVLEDPAPAALFLRLGDGAMHFELRAYVSQLRERLETTSDLHRTIIKKFRELGIQIAFPQMDLHIRDVPPRRTGMLARLAGAGDTSVPREASGSTAG